MGAMCRVAPRGERGQIGSIHSLLNTDLKIIQHPRPKYLQHTDNTFVSLMADSAYLSSIRAPCWQFVNLKQDQDLPVQPA